jgi:hypothetical protein
MTTSCSSTTASKTAPRDLLPGRVKPQQVDDVGQNADDQAARAHKEPHAVAAALLARDPEAAQAAMRVHLRHSQQVLLQLVGYQTAWDAAGNGA